MNLAPAERLRLKEISLSQNDDWCAVHQVLKQRRGLTTRKFGLPIDPSQDLTSECYDSWHAFFKEARELIKAIPLQKNPRSVELRQLVCLSQAVLNNGLRPHLQRWQARFRSWNAETRDADDRFLAPQEAQRHFPEWTELCDDLLADEPAPDRLCRFARDDDSSFGGSANYAESLVARIEQVITVRCIRLIRLAINYPKLCGQKWAKFFWVIINT